MQHLFSMKRNEVVMLSTVWTNLESVVLRDRSYTRTVPCGVSPCVMLSRVGKFIQTESISVVPRGWASRGTVVGRGE